MPNPEKGNGLAITLGLLGTAAVIGGGVILLKKKGILGSKATTQVQPTQQIQPQQPQQMQPVVDPVQQVRTWINTQLQAGQTPDVVKQQMIAQGYSQEQINQFF